MMRHDWSLEELRHLHDMPLLELVIKASQAHVQRHRPSEVQCCQLISVKTGGCPENCHYCPQSSHHPTAVKAEPMMSREEVLRRAVAAKNSGATRICLGAAWRQVREGKAFDSVLEIVKSVAALDVEVCCTLGMLTPQQAQRLKDAGLHSYNHNIDSSAEFYSKIITTRTYQDRLNTLGIVRQEGLSVCCGGIIGMGESIEDRLKMLMTLTSLQPHPESVPINMLTAIEGTPLAGRPKVPFWEMLRMVATARLALPQAMVRLSAGRLGLSISQQALCFLAGANSIHTGEVLLTTPNPTPNADEEMFRILGLIPKPKVPLPLSRQPDIGFLQERLEKRRQEGTLRRLRPESELIDLTSNDYLGFARSLLLSEQIEFEMERLITEGGIRPQVGSTGSRLLTGNSRYAETVEETICKFHGAESGILFNSGYTANTGLLSSVITKEDTILIDSQVHASTWEGGRLSGARLLLFRHNEATHLESQLKKATGRVFVCVETLYSMSGDIAPLAEINALCEKYGAYLIVDEAHATGILGPQGRGLVSALGLENSVFARIHTFGKALGTHGAIVMGSHFLRDYLINFSRPLIYSTAFPLHSLVSIQCAYRHLQQASPEREQLEALILYFNKKIVDSALPIRAGQTPIQSVPVSGIDQVRNLSQKIAHAGLDVRPILSPTVRKGAECLRVCLHAFNTRDEVDRLIAALSAESQEIFVA